MRFYPLFLLSGMMEFCHRKKQKGRTRKAENRVGIIIKTNNHEKSTHCRN